MDIYVALDCSLPLLLLQPDGSISENKLEMAINFMVELIKSIDHSELKINLVQLSKHPKILFEGAKTELDVRKAFNRKSIESGVPDYLALRDLIVRRRSTLNFEMIILTESTNYYWIPTTFVMPCIVRFVAISDGKSGACPKMLAQCLAISTACSEEAGLLTSSTTDTLTPLVLHNDNHNDDSNNIAQQLAKVKRTEKRVLLSFSKQLTIGLQLTPGIPLNSRAILGAETAMVPVPVKSTVDNLNNKHNHHTLSLIGFIKANVLLHLPSTPLLHAVHLPLSHNDNNTKESERNKLDFHLVAEALGSEGQLAVCQHEESNQIGVLRPLREDISDPWTLSLQFISSDLFHFEPSNSATTQPPPPSFADLKGLSYKSTARTYWTNSYGLNSDLLKLNRLLKRADRFDQFQSEMQRISQYALACGYHSFAPTLATMLEKRCSSTNIAEENKVPLRKIIDRLRSGGGFRQLI